MRLTSLALLLASALHAGAVWAESAPALPVLDGVGGEFSASSSLGRRVTLSDYRGRVVLLFFGYTSCPDACPATLAHLEALMQRLGEASNDVQVLLVTVDPETDTPEFLARYLARFDARFVGLTGTREEVDRIAALFMAKHHRSHDVKVSTKHHRSETFTDKTYLYTHSQQIYLLDGEGRTRGMFFSGSPLEEMQRAVHALRDEISAAAEREQPESDRGPGKDADRNVPPDHHYHQHRQRTEGTQR